MFINGAEVGDGVAIRIRDITVTSMATASGHDSSPEGFCLGDPYVAARCPVCDTVWPETHVEGIGQDAVKCDKCGNAVTPFKVVHGYTVTFDDTRAVGLTLPKAAAETIAHDANHYAALPDGSRQHSILTYAPSDMPGTLVRMRPFSSQSHFTRAFRSETGLTPQVWRDVIRAPQRAAPPSSGGRRAGSAPTVPD